MSAAILAAGRPNRRSGVACVGHTMHLFSCGGMPGRLLPANVSPADAAAGQPNRLATGIAPAIFPPFGAAQNGFG